MTPADGAVGIAVRAHRWWAGPSRKTAARLIPTKISARGAKPLTASLAESPSRLGRWNVRST